MTRLPPESREPKPAVAVDIPAGGDVSPAEEAARAASPSAVSDEEKASLAAEVSRIEDA